MPTRLTDTTRPSPRLIRPRSLAMPAPVAAAPHVSTAILVALIVSVLQAARLLGG